MLLITRRVGESLCILPIARVVLVEVCGRQARLGVEAQQSVVVHREEIVLEKIPDQLLSELVTESNIEERAKQISSLRAYLQMRLGFCYERYEKEPLERNHRMIDWLSSLLARLPKS